MRLFKTLGIVVLAMCAVALASEKNLGIHKVADVSFSAAVQVGTTVIPAGEYKVRHTMDGQDHVMTFTRNGTTEVYKVKCTLVALQKKAPQDQQLIETSGNQRVLRELIFRGDTAKHVF